MPTDDSRLPLRPVLPSQRPPTTRNGRGQWMAGVSGNPRGRPTNARLRAKALASDARTKRPTAYRGLTGSELVRVATAAYGKSWQGPLAKDIMMSRRELIRWSQGVHKISREREMDILLVCHIRLRRNGAYVTAMYRRARAHRRALLQQEQTPSHKPLTPRGEGRRFSK
jgi:hypothetical protein